MIVDHIGAAAEIKSELAHHSKRDQAQSGIDEREAVRALLTALDMIHEFFHGLDNSQILGATASRCCYR